MTRIARSLGSKDAGPASRVAARWRQAARALTGRAVRTAILAGICLAALAPPAGAQMPDLNRMALEWLRGRWASPIVCEHEGTVTRTVRRLIVQPGPRHSRPASDKVTFHGIDLDSASRCSDAMGRKAPEIRGSLLVTLPGMSRPDLAQAEFQRTLRHEGGFDYEILSGRLRMVGWEDGAEPRIVDFAGGTVRVREVRRGSDAARILSDVRGPRRLTLEAVNRDESERHLFHMVLYDFR